MNEELERWAEFELSTKRIMEVAIQDNGALCVHETSEIDSPVVKQLKSREQLRVLATNELDDGTRRALIVLERHATSTGSPPPSPRGPMAGATPLGWVTSLTAEGEPLLHLHARPFYMVASEQPLKVRKGFEETSTFIMTLLTGTRFHVIESRRTPLGKQRVCVTVLGDEEPIGWVTAKMADGYKTIRELRNDELADPIPAPVRQHLSKRSRSGDAPARQTRMRALVRPASARDFRHLPQLNMMRPASARDLHRGGSDGNFSQRSAPTNGSALSTPPPQATPSPKPAAHTGQKPVGKAVKSVAEGQTKEPVAKDRFATAAKDVAAFKRWSASASNVQVDDAADDLLAQRSKYLDSATVEAVVTALMKQASDEEAAAADKQLSVRIGEIIHHQKVNVADLMHDWDPKGDGRISKMAFRQHVRKLMPENPPSTIDLDALYVAWDVQGDGKLGTDEVKASLKRCRDAAKSVKSSMGAAHARAEVHRGKAEQIVHVVTITQALEQAAEALRVGRLGTVGSQLGERLNAKGARWIR